MGGPGHLAILFAKAMEAPKVVGISRREDKRQETLDLGTHDSIATNDDKDWASTWAGKFDIIISTNSSPELRLKSVLSSTASLTSYDTSYHLRNT